MPRIRYLKPEFFLDTELARLPIHVRLFYQGLWCHADKAGRIRDDPLFLKAVIYPYDDIDPEKCLQMLTHSKPLSQRPFIVRYESDGKRYIQIVSWSEHQRPHHTEKESQIPPHTPLIKGKEKGKQLEASLTLSNGGLTVNDATKDITMTYARQKQLFDIFWDRWPKKMDKANAIKVWQKLPLSDELFDTIISSLDIFAASEGWLKEGGQYIPGPAKWLRGKRWEDEPTVSPDPPDEYPNDPTEEEARDFCVRHGLMKAVAQ